MTAPATLPGTRAAALARLVRTATPQAPARAPGPVSALLPQGAARPGEVYAVRGSRALQLALAAETCVGDGWCALVGLPEVGAEAARELGLDLDRCVVVPDPGDQWLAVTAVLLDALALVVLRPPPGRCGELTPGQSSRLTARMRGRGSVLLVDGPWPGAHAALTVTGQEWEGIDAGRGPLRAGRLTVRVEGRGPAARPRQHRVRIGLGTGTRPGQVAVSALDEQAAAAPAATRTAVGSLAAVPSLTAGPASAGLPVAGRAG